MDDKRLQEIEALIPDREFMARDVEELIAEVRRLRFERATGVSSVMAERVRKLVESETVRILADEVNRLRALLGEALEDESPDLTERIRAALGIDDV
jgi:hypothetical protein